MVNIRRSPTRVFSRHQFFVLAVITLSCFTKFAFCLRNPSPSLSLPTGFLQKLHRVQSITQKSQLDSNSNSTLKSVEFLKPQLTENETNETESKNNRNITNIRTVNKNSNPSFLSSNNFIVENVIPSYIKDSFKPPEEFREFANSTLFFGVSDDCRVYSMEFLSQFLFSVPEGTIRQPDTWALQMADAWGKFPSGLLSGHTAIPGDFYECVQIRGNYAATKFKGSYCSTYLSPGEALLTWMEDQLAAPTTKLPSTTEATASNFSVSLNLNSNLTDDEPFDFSLRNSVAPEELITLMLTNIGKGVNFFPFIGTCFPSSCSAKDSQTILTNFYNKATSGFLQQTVAACYTDEKPPFDAGDIAVIVLLSVIGLLCLVGSIFDILSRQSATVTDTKSKEEIPTVSRLLLAFSVPLNTEKLLNTNVDIDNLGCLHGLRFLSICWVLLAHTWGMNLLQFCWNTIDMQISDREWSLQAISNGTVAVDTFFVISGTLISYNLLRELHRSKGKLNYPLLVLHRFLRLTPTYIILIGIMATLVPYLGSGPQWFMVEAEGKFCEQNWWYNILYINNFIAQAEVCYSESWYLANDMQFFILSPLIIYPIWRWRKIGFGILGAFSIASVIIPAVITYMKELPPTLVVSIDNKTYMDDVYVKPWNRMGPYLVGIFLGYVLYTKSIRPRMYRKIPLVTVLIGWLICTTIALFVIFGIPNSFLQANEEETLKSVGTAVYSGLHRFGWGMVISWIIFACTTGHGGWINQFLSWKVFVPLGRLTFCIYISSFHVQKIFHFTSVHPVHYSTYGSVNLYFSHVIMCSLVGYILTVTLESPFIQIEKILLPPNKRNQNPATKTDLPIIQLNNNNYDKNLVVGDTK